ncbi:MAG: transposase [Solobacterium sp.]|nr:transposase [Solobacterium sp.]
MQCPRCLNTDPSYFYHGSKGWYCRRCVSFGRVMLEEELEPVSLEEIRDDGQEYTLKYPLTPAQIKVSHECAERIEDTDILLKCVCGSGKTEMVLETIALMLGKHKKVCFAIARRQVVLELAERLSGIFSHAHVVPVCHGYTTVTDGDLIVCTTHGTIRFRGDSAFYNMELMKFLEDEKITYYIRAKGFESLHSEAMDDMISRGIDWKNYTPFHPYHGEFLYAIKGKQPRRILYKAYSVMKDGQISFFPVIYAIVTNDMDISPEEGMHFYELRGASENFTKELKNDFDGGHVSHKDFWKNEMDFLISAYAYNVFHLFQNMILEGKDRMITMNTFRLIFQ